MTGWSNPLSLHIALRTTAGNEGRYHNRSQKDEVRMLALKGVCF